MKTQLSALYQGPDAYDPGHFYWSSEEIMEMYQRGERPILL